MSRGFTLILGLMVCIVGLIVCDFQGCSEGSSSPSTPTSSTPIPATLPVFPLVTSANHRYLQDQKGIPFPILGRTAWFITSLSDLDYKRFIDDTVAKGYNAIEFNAINRWDAGNHPPFDGNGALPFTKRLDRSDWDGSLSYGNINTEAPDFSLTNETYWTHVVQFSPTQDPRAFSVSCSLLILDTKVALRDGCRRGWPTARAE